jgi:hypothetical protein
LNYYAGVSRKTKEYDMKDETELELSDGEKLIWASCFVTSALEHYKRYSVKSSVIGGAEVATKLVLSLRESMETIETMREKEVVNCVKQMLR